MTIPSSQAETIFNPVTGDRLTFITKRADLDYIKIRFDLPPGAKGSPLHYHSTMVETFTVLQGRLDLEIGYPASHLSLVAGESVRVEPGTHHSFCNNSNYWVSFTTENNPAQGFEKFVRGLYGLAIDGKVNLAGMPTNILQFVLLIKHGDVIPVGIHPLVFKLVLSLLVRVGGLFGVERSLWKYWPNQRIDN